MSQSLATLNFTGWKKVTAAVPDGQPPSRGSPFRRQRRPVAGPVGPGQRERWTAPPPTVALSLSGTNVTARITDASQNALSADRCPHRGWPGGPFTWDA